MSQKRLEVGQKVLVGLFEGRVVRIIEWHGSTLVDVEIDGVVDRYPFECVEAK